MEPAMERLTKLLPELKHILTHHLRQQPGCQDCHLRTVCVHRPDHTGCNWSAEVDFPDRSEDDAARHLRQARQVITLVRERYNVEAAIRTSGTARTAAA
jgi:hypothetical protein